MEANRGQDLMALRIPSPTTSSSSSNSHPQPPTGLPGRRAPLEGPGGRASGSRTAAAAPRIPVRMTSHPEEIPLESEEDEPGTAPMACPFLECPSSTTTKTRRALVAHLAAKHVSHGQVVPTATLQALNMRVCGDPCRTLVTAGSRCRNCRSAPPGERGSADAEPGVPMPLLPPPACLPPRPGAPTSGQCPQLVPSFQDVLTAQVPTIRHIPAMCRSAVASELARLVREVAVPVPTWEALHRLLCFPKLVLRSSGRGGSKHQRQAALDLDKRLRLFQAGQLETLWKEARALAEKTPRTSQPRRGHEPGWRRRVSCPVRR